MASSQWKVWEKEVANDLGGIRTGPTGKATPDVSDLPVPFAPECKYGALSLTKRAMEQAKRNAKGDPWGLFIREKMTGKRVVVLDYAFFLTMWNSYVKDKTNE